MIVKSNCQSNFKPHYFKRKKLHRNIQSHTGRNMNYLHTHTRTHAHIHTEEKVKNSSSQLNFKPLKKTINSIAYQHINKKQSKTKKVL